MEDGGGGGRWRGRDNGGLDDDQLLCSVGIVIRSISRTAEKEKVNCDMPLARDN